MQSQILELQFALDTFYLLICGALVMWMAAGFAMLESGLIRAKNTTEILTKNIALYATACIMFMVCGYQFMWGGGFFLSDLQSITGFDATAALAASAEEGFTGNTSHANAADFFFQVVFVATSMSIVSGAVAERMKLWSFLAFAVVMTGVIYPLEGGWAWAGNEVFGLFSLTLSDYAGSAVVHMTGATAALAGVLLLGPRSGKYGRKGRINAIPGANMPLATLGTFILWLGWFGFNGGSTLKLGDMTHANEVAHVFLNTNASAAGGLVAALITARLWFRKADLTMALNGALAGLVAVTADPAHPSPMLATMIGATGGIIVVFSIVALDKLQIDDPVGAISVHGSAGLFGIFAVLLSNPEATFIGQLVGAATIFAWVFIASFVIWSILKATMGIRVGLEDETEGVDLTECGMDAYPEFIPTNAEGLSPHH